LIRTLTLALALTAAAPAANSAPPAPAGDPAAPEFVQAIEFPYYLYPRAQWERELTWMKNIGIRTVAFSIPWNWHQVGAAEFDFNGRTSPRRDLQGLIKIFRRLGLRAWILPAGQAANWPGGGIVANADLRGTDAWFKALEEVLGPQTVAHGGPIAWVQGRRPAIEAPEPPKPVAVLAATDAGAFLQSRKMLVSGVRSLLWTDVEDALYPAGWEPVPGSLLRNGVIGLSGDERPGAVALRRQAGLLRYWAPLLLSMRPVPMPKPASGSLPRGVTAVELSSPAISAVVISNNSPQAFHDELRVFEPVSKKTLVIPSVSVPAGESLWLPVSVSMGQNGLCRECSHFSNAESIAYATAELLSIEYENGILAMEFSAPEAGEVILQLERQPVGPFLAGGKPSKFEWDESSLRARLTIPAGTGADHRVRVGIAMEEPETSAFFNEARRLVIGAKNTLSTAYSSADVAARSRLRLPDGYTAVAHTKSPNEIDYELAVPADAVHGDYANLTLEADGISLGRARLQLFRPLSVRMVEAMQIHIGQHSELTPDPPVMAIEPKAGTNLEVSLRNNWPGIQTFRLEAAGEGLEFFPPKTEISIAAMEERQYSLRVFGQEGVAGLRDWHLKTAGGASFDLPMRVLLLPRGRTVVWSADLDGDGAPEWVLESAHARAIFSTQDGGRWMEFTWKDSNTNFLPEQGAFAAKGAVEIHASGDAIEIAGNGWKRKVKLSDATLTVEQSPNVPADGLSPLTQGNVALSMERLGAASIYTLK
jgi:hypothetical protein